MAKFQTQKRTSILVETLTCAPTCPPEFLHCFHLFVQIRVIQNARSLETSIFWPPPPSSPLFVPVSFTCTSLPQREFALVSYPPPSVYFSLCFKGLPFPLLQYAGRLTCCLRIHLTLYFCYNSSFFKYLYVPCKVERVLSEEIYLVLCVYRQNHVSVCGSSRNIPHILFLAAASILCSSSFQLCCWFQSLLTYNISHFRLCNRLYLQLRLYRQQLIIDPCFAHLVMLDSFTDGNVAQPNCHLSYFFSILFADFLRSCRKLFKIDFLFVCRPRCSLTEFDFNNWCLDWYLWIDIQAVAQSLISAGAAWI